MTLFSRSPIQIPLVYTQSNHLICTLEINDQNALFLVDTGASNSCFDLEKAKKYAVTSKGEALSMTAASETKLEACESETVQLKYMGQDLAKIQLMLIDMQTINTALSQEGGTEIEGILGADLFSKKKAVVDYNKGCLILNC